MSHVPAVNLNPEPVTLDESVGGNRPRGGIDRKDDREPEFMLKSADHYRRRLAGARTERALTLIRADLELTLRAWTHTPLKRHDIPKPGDAFFTRWARERIRDGWPDSEIVRLGGCSRQYVNRLRRSETSLTA